MGAKRHVRPISSMPNGKWGNGLAAFSFSSATPLLPQRSLLLFPIVVCILSIAPSVILRICRFDNFREAAAGTSVDTLYSILTSILILLRLWTKWTGWVVWVRIEFNSHRYTKEGQIVTRARLIHSKLCPMLAVFRRQKTFGDGCCLAGTITTNKTLVILLKTCRKSMGTTSSGCSLLPLNESGWLQRRQDKAIQ